MPALVLDADWNLLRANRGGRWLAATLLPWTAHLPAATSVNMLDLLAHPDGLTTVILNLAEVGPTLLAHVRQKRWRIRRSAHGWRLSPRDRAPGSATTLCMPVPSVSPHRC